MPSDNTTSGNSSLLARDRLWQLLLVLATFAAYQPAWNGQPIWDDAAHVTPAERQSLNGLWRIWTDPRETQQYYPIVHSAFWLEHKIWGDATLGYHLVNIFLHATAALMLLKILRALNVPAAGLAAAIFALHPIEVESVAWMTELKNTLSAVCYFGAALLYLRFERTGNKRTYAAALAVFATGLLAKSVIATLPAALLVVFWWQRGKISWKQDVLRLLPFFALGIAAGLFTSWTEHKYVGAYGAEFNLSIIERILVAGRVTWFYAGKLFWPVNLIFTYPRWKISVSEWWQYIYPAAALLVLGVLWAIRKIARGPLAAALFFVGTLFPALGFVNVFPFRYSFVADHFQYLAGIGIIVVASFVIQTIASRNIVLQRGTSLALLGLLAVLTWRQSRMYSDIETLWRTTLARNPECWLAEDDLGALLYQKGKIDEAIQHFQKSLALEPNDAEAEHNFGSALVKKGQVDEGIRHFQKALELRPAFAEAHFSLGKALLGKGRLDEALVEFAVASHLRPDLVYIHNALARALLEKGLTDEAIAEFQRSLEILPDAQIYYDLGLALHQKGRDDEAILAFQEAATLRPKFAEAQNNLGHFLLEKGRAAEAIPHLQKALATRPDFAQAHYNLSRAFLRGGQTGDAIKHLQKALALKPGSVEARNDLAGIAWVMATSPTAAMRNGAKAVELARQTDQLAQGNSPMMAAILGAAYAEAGKYEQAMDAAERALKLAGDQKNAAAAAAIQQQLDAYKAGKPFRDTGPAH